MESAEFTIKTVTIQTEADRESSLRAEFNCRFREKDLAVVAREAHPDVIGVSQEVIPLVLTMSEDALRLLRLPRINKYRFVESAEDVASRIESVEYVLDLGLENRLPSLPTRRNREDSSLIYRVWSHRAESCSGFVTSPHV